MSTAENGELYYEAGWDAYPMEPLVDSGDAKTFDSSAIYFSDAQNRSPDIKPDGLSSGGVISVPASGSNDVVDVSAVSGYLGGVLKVASASVDLAIARPATAVAKVIAITLTTAGTIVAVEGADSADSSFSSVRGANGGPPYIPVGSFSIGEVRLTSDTAGEILSTEIFQVIDLHTERYDSPGFEPDFNTAQVVMDNAIPLIHTGDLPKAINASYFDPLFTAIRLASDYVPTENSQSLNSKQIYNKTRGSVTKSLSQGSFTVYLNDGVTDPFLQVKDDKRFIKFKPDRLKSPFMLDHGTIGIGRTFSVSEDIQAACTISADTAAIEVEA